MKALQRGDIYKITNRLYYNITCRLYSQNYKVVKTGVILVRLKKDCRYNFIEVPVSRQESERSSICVLGVSLPGHESERSSICV